MPVEPPSALEQQVDRREVAHHDVDVVIERLLEHLGADDDHAVAGATRRALPDKLLDPLLALLALVEREARVEQHMARIGKRLAEGSVDRLSIIDAVAQPGNSPSVAHQIEEIARLLLRGALLRKPQGEALL